MDMDIHEFNPICWVFYGFLIHLSWFFSSISNHKSSKILRKPPMGHWPKRPPGSIAWTNNEYRPAWSDPIDDDGWKPHGHGWMETFHGGTNWLVWHLKVALKVAAFIDGMWKLWKLPFPLQKNVGAIARLFPIRWIRKKMNKNWQAPSNTVTAEPTTCLPKGVEETVHPVVRVHRVGAANGPQTKTKKDETPSFCTQHLPKSVRLLSENPLIFQFYGDPVFFF